MKQYISETLDCYIKQLYQQIVIAYPTEAVFGLGCDPDSEQAVMKLLTIKKRPIEKGLILIAANYQQLKPYIFDKKLSVEQRKRMFATWPGSITWVLPANPHTPRWLTGRFNSLAVRITRHPIVQKLCIAFGKPLVSTSANLNGQTPCRYVEEVLQQFGKNFPVLSGKTNNQLNPSEIRDIVNGNIIRQG